MKDSGSRAWRLLEALDAVPFGDEARLAIIQRALDEAGLIHEHKERYHKPLEDRCPQCPSCLAEYGPECHVPECSCH